MCEELKCKVCGKLEIDDKHFWIESCLCNRHALQYRNHGRFLDNKCIINPPRRKWTDDEKQQICNLYNDGEATISIAKIFHTSVESIRSILERCGVELEVRFKNDSRYKASYQEYDWCYERYVIRRMSYEEMAIEGNTTPRTIQKWCSEKHRLNRRTLRKELHLTDKQKELVMFSLLGDGHIDKRETQPLFIVSHAINQKDYLFWKYGILENVCNQPPTLLTNLESAFSGDKIYKCQDAYRFCTKILDDLIPIRSMNKLEIISQLNEFGLAIHFLDDGCHTDEFWELCYAAFTEEEKELYHKILKERFNIEPHLRKDNRYVGFGKVDSKKIDEIILRNIPNDLDIIKYKILKDDNYAEVC